MGKRLYKLQKGETCTIRTDEAGIKDALANGYTYLGECDENYEIISNAAPVFGNDEEPAKAKVDKKPKVEKPED